jgi:photosystem II stability/assembly factor-like uncharacterized protein
MKSLLLLISFFLTTNLFAQGFNSVTTNDGQNVTAVGNNGLLFRSSNGGNTWSSNTIGTDNLMWACSYNDNVWIVGSAGKLFKTMKSLSPITTIQLPTSNTLNSCDNLGITSYVCGDGGIIYKSTNRGNNWALANTGIPNVKLNSISFLDVNNGVVVGNGGTLYVTTDGGNSWTSNPISTNNLLKAKYLSTGIVVVGENGTILRKTGLSWLIIDSKTKSDIRGVTGTIVNELRVCGGGGFIRNNISSPNFFKFEQNPMMANLVDICYSDANTGFAVSSLNNAIIRTTNGGTSWELPAGTTVSYNWSQKISPGSGIGNNLCMHPTNKNAMFVVYGNKVYVSWNRGDTWTQISTISIGTRAHSFYVSPVDSNVWLAAMESSPTDAVVRSTNYGATWTNILARNFSTYGQPLEMDQNNPSTYYFAPDGATTGFFKSTDNGATFNSITTGSNPFTSPCDIIVEWGNSNVMFIGDDGADIHKTTNGGVNWFTVKPGSSSEIPSMCNSVFDPSFCYATTWGSSQVFKTVNNGDVWGIVSNNSGSGWGSDVCREDPTLVLTGNYGAQSYLSTNNGANFFNVNTGLSGAGAGIIVPERGYLLNMQTQALFKLVITYSVLTSVGDPVSSSIPTSLELYQNYPNPFNPSTSIRFDVPQTENISLKIYNIAGKEVASLFNGVKNAGSYEVNFNADGLASGVYFYKLITGSSSITKKMMLLK